MVEQLNQNSFAPSNYHANEQNNEQLETARIHRTKRSSRYDRPSYHERKLNMTNFRGTAETSDQHAIESETRIHVSLPNSNTSTVVSLEEIEHLALKDLNGSAPILSENNTNIENLPEPEMLIRPYRVRPRPISERFDNIYLFVNDYPL